MEARTHLDMHNMYINTHKRNHILVSCTKVILRNQTCAGLRLTCAWFIILEHLVAYIFAHSTGVKFASAVRKLASPFLIPAIADLIASFIFPGLTNHPCLPDSLVMLPEALKFLISIKLCSSHYFHHNFLEGLRELLF